jgi:carboxymethylenebutenolidase
MMRRLELATPDGPMELRVFAPQDTPRGGVIFYMDAFGLRPELDGLCAAYAAAGWLTCLPDLYHRLPCRSFAVPPTEHAPLDPAMTVANLATTLAMTVADTAVILDHAARRCGVTRFGAVGTCMGARHALAAAAALPQQVRAAACLHGGRMVWEGPDSPHRLIPGLPGGLYIALARDDETCPEPHQRILEAMVAEAGPRAMCERYDALHGWSFPERWCHDAVAAAHAFARVQALFAREVEIDR